MQLPEATIDREATNNFVDFLDGCKIKGLLLR
jgi:hypothetical protein